jgi:hypothetical protein
MRAAKLAMSMREGNLRPAWNALITAMNEEFPHISMDDVIEGVKLEIEARRLDRAVATDPDFYERWGDVDE